MADIQKTVEILFTAIDKTGVGLDQVNQNLQNVAAPVANLTKGLLLLEGALIAIGVAFGAQAFNNAVKFEAALLDLQKVLSDSEGDASQYTDTVDALSIKYGQSATDILQGAATIKQAGFTVEESFSLQDVALKAAVISELDVASATELMISTLKGFKAPASEATRLLDVQNEISNNYATNLGELAKGMAALSPIASTMGLSFEETAAILTPVIEVFRSGTESGNALKIALISLIDDSAPVGEALAKLGVSQTDLNGRMRSGKDILFDVAQAFTTLDENQKLVVTSQIVGERQAARTLEVFDGLGKITNVLATGMGAAGSANTELAIRLASSETQIDRAKAAYEALSKTIGEQFRVELTEVIGSVTDLEIAFGKVVKAGSFEPLLNLIRPQLAEWKTLIAGIAEALPEAFEKVDFSPIIDAFGNIGETLTDTFGDFDLTTAEGLAEAIQAVIDTLGTMIDVTDGIVSAFIAMAAPIIEILKWFSQLDSDTQKLLGQIGALAIGITAASPAVTALSSVLSLLGSAGIGGLLLKLGPLLLALTGPVGIVAALIAAGTAVGFFLKGLGDTQNLETLEKELKIFASESGQAIEEVEASLVSLGATSLTEFRKARDAGLLFSKSLEGVHMPINDVQKGMEALGLAAEDAGGRFVGPLTEAQTKLTEFGFIAVQTGDKIVKAFEVPAALTGGELERLLDSLGAEFELVTTESGRFITRLEDLDALTVDTSGSVEDLKRQWELWQAAVASGNKTQEEGTVAIKAIAQALDEKAGILAEVTTAEGDYIKQLKDHVAAEEAALKALEASGASEKELIEARASAAKARLDLTNATEQSTVAVRADTEAIASNKKEIEEQVKALTEFKLGLEEIQSQERVAKFKISAEVDIADIEANRDIILAAFASIDVGIQSTGETLVGLFGELSSASSVPFGTSELFKQIEKESDLRQKEFELQEKLILAQIDLQKAKTDAIEKGEGTITVSGDGLEPHIKAFMFEILKEIQIEASADAQALLLFE